jgi:hypothetical protein
MLCANLDPSSVPFPQTKDENQERHANNNPVDPDQLRDGGSAGAEYHREQQAKDDL